MYNSAFDKSSGQNVLPFPGAANPNSQTPHQDLLPPANASADLRFAFSKMALSEWGEFALGGRTEDGDIDTTIYQWIDDADGARWQIQHPVLLEAEASGWMAIYAADEVNGGKPKSCVNTLQQQLVHRRRFMPKTPEGMDIVPLRNAYLLIDKDGTIRAMAPDRKYGIDYNIQVDLDMSRVDENGVYTPVHSTAGLWHSYIHSTLTADDVRAFASEALSTVLLSTCYEKGIWLFGEGENGKSVILHLLKNLAPQHHAALRLSRLIKDQFGTNKLNGKRLATVAEMPPRLSQDLQTVIKEIISRDCMSGEKKGKDEYSFTPKVVLIFATNKHPEMSDHEHGFWRKIETLPFTNRVEASSKVLGLASLISQDPKEMGQFIDWLLIGAVQLTKRGRWMTFDEKPLAIQQLAYTQRCETDTVMAWQHDNELLFDQNSQTSKNKIYEDYCSFTKGESRHPISATKFWIRIREHFRHLNFDTEGEQRTINGKRHRCVNLVLHGLAPDFTTKPAPVCTIGPMLTPVIEGPTDELGDVFVEPGAPCS